MQPPCKGSLLTYRLCVDLVDIKLRNNRLGQGLKESELRKCVLVNLPRKSLRTHWALLRASLTPWWSRCEGAQWQHSHRSRAAGGGPVLPRSLRSGQLTVNSSEQACHYSLMESARLAFPNSRLGDIQPASSRVQHFGCT
jgi:hypothetical protein